jgi:hypothetical protein
MAPISIENTQPGFMEAIAEMARKGGNGPQIESPQSQAKGGSKPATDTSKHPQADKRPGNLSR